MKILIFSSNNYCSCIIIHIFKNACTEQWPHFPLTAALLHFEKFLCDQGFNQPSQMLNNVIFPTETNFPNRSKHILTFTAFVMLWSNGLVVKALDSQSKSLVFKTIGWLQGRLSLSSFRGQ